MRHGLILAVLMLPATAALADEPITIHAPAPSVATTDDPTALWVNPAGLAFGFGLEGLFLHTQDIAHGQSSSEALVLRYSGLAASLEYLRPEIDGRHRQLLRYSVALAPLNIRDMFGVGAVVHINNPTEGSAETTVDWSAGAMLRPWRYLSLGLTGRNLGQSSVYGLRQDRTLEIGLAVRPGTDRVTLSADASLFSGESSFPLGFRAEVRPIDGLGLVATADLQANLGLGVMLDLAHLGIGSFTWFEPDAFGGNTSYARISQAEHPRLFTLGGDWIRLDIDGRTVGGARITEVPLLGSDEVSVLQLVLALERATRDPAVDGALLVIRGTDLGPADIQDLRGAVLAFRQAGKKVAAYLDSGGDLEYLLAAAADRILMAPTGVLAMVGPSITTMYLTETLAAVGVQVEAEWAEQNPYKSAPEQFTRSAPSPAARESFESLVGDLATQFVEAVAAGRGLTHEQVTALRDRAPLDAAEAQQAGLIDDVAYLDQVPSKLRDVPGLNPGPLDGGYIQPQARRMTWGPRPRIGVVDLRGTIVPGISSRGLLGGRRIGGTTAAAAIEGAGLDESLEALVIRVDSPGGSGHAADQIWNQVQRAARRKPVVASMGNLAASGGYYIACGAATILAEPATLTGSIGAYVLRLDASGLLDLLRVRTATFQAGPHGDLAGYFRPATPEERGRIRTLVTRFYSGFLDKVAACRHKDVDEIRPVAGGRVWTGRQAQERGLVDELGGLSRAITLAREQAGIDPDEEVELLVLPEEPFSLRAVLDRLGAQTESGSEELGAALLRLGGLPPDLLGLLLSLEREQPLALTPIWIEVN